MPETLPTVELIRALPITQPHACLHAVAELADDGEHSRCHAQTSQDIPQKGSADGIICFGEVNKVQVQGGVLLSAPVPAVVERHINRRALGSEPTLFLRKIVLAFAVVTKTTRDEFKEYFACVSHEGVATIVASRCSIILFVQHLNRCIFGLLRHATFISHSDDDIVELSKRVQFSFARPSGARPGGHRALPPFDSPTHGSPPLLRA